MKHFYQQIIKENRTILRQIHLSKPTITTARNVSAHFWHLHNSVQLWKAVRQNFFPPIRNLLTINCEIPTGILVHGSHLCFLPFGNDDVNTRQPANDSPVLEPLQGRDHLPSARVRLDCGRLQLHPAVEKDSPGADSAAAAAAGPTTTARLKQHSISTNQRTRQSTRCSGWTVSICGVWCRCSGSASAGSSTGRKRNAWPCSATRVPCTAARWRRARSHRGLRRAAGERKRAIEVPPF